MNEKGQVFFYAFMLGITIIVLALALAPAVRERTDTTMTDLDCNNASISSFDKVTCYVVDLTIFHFIGGLIFVAGIVITARIIMG